jgi:Uma2 family endonuclease
MNPFSPLELEQRILYPDSDGAPIGENTLQFRWIVTIHGNLDALFARQPQVFVAADLFWYPVEGAPDICTAPDVLVVFGRPKQERLSYLQWQEDDVAPQVVWEVLSPGNRAEALAAKLDFYERYGVEEYYTYDPARNEAHGWRRMEGRLLAIEPLAGWISPRLQIRFELGSSDLELFLPDGRPFLTFLEITERAAAEQERADQEADRADSESRRADAAEKRALLEAARAQEETERAQVEAERAQKEAERAQKESERAQAESERAAVAEARAGREEEQARLARERAERLAQQLRELGFEPHDS